MGAGGNILGGASTGAAMGSIIPGVGNIVGAGAGAVLGGLRSIGAGRRTENSFGDDYENVLGQQVLPQVIAMAQAGNMEGAKALLQKGVADYYAGIGEYQAQGGNYAKTANQSLNHNKALHDTITQISNQVGLQYAPGVGFAQPSAVDANGAPGSPDAESQAKAALYGLDAPLAQGDPYALKGVTAKEAPQLPNGYDPATLARMNAGAMEAPAAAGLQEMSQAKRALSQNGLMDSPAAAALQQTVARQTGQAQTAAKRDVSIQDAKVGVDNSRINTQNTIGQNNLQTQYDWGKQTGNFDELNNRYAGATRALAGA